MDLNRTFRDLIRLCKKRLCKHFKADSFVRTGALWREEVTRRTNYLYCAIINRTSTSPIYICLRCRCRRRKKIISSNNWDGQLNRERRNVKLRADGSLPRMDNDGFVDYRDHAIVIMMYKKHSDGFLLCFHYLWPQISHSIKHSFLTLYMWKILTMW